VVEGLILEEQMVERCPHIAEKVAPEVVEAEVVTK
jgi:hypothetical protein